MEFIEDSNYLDQHFLIDNNIVDLFINTASFNKNDIVLEIGPGKGVLSKKIAPKVKKLILVEKDDRLIDELKLINNTKVIHDSILDIDIPECNKIITSLPYSIIEPFITKIKNIKIEGIYMIMGINYINNVIDKKINYLSLMTNTFFNSEKIIEIPSAAFKPMPRTMSGIIVLKPKLIFEPIDTVFKTLYNLDNKKIKNGLREAFINLKNITKKESKELINKLNISEEILNKNFNLINNEELDILYNEIKECLE